MANKEKQTSTPFFLPAEILLPSESCNLSRWAVLACDQFTSQPEYWNDAEKYVSTAPSTLRMIIPEAFLEKPGLEKKITAVHAAMREYVDTVLIRRVSGYIYIERLLNNGAVRQGLVGNLDLEAYSYNEGANPQVRPSEGTVLERIPPRLAVRRGAPLESPHIIMLADDEQNSLIEPLAAKKEKFAMLYNTPLMLGGGRVQGWAVTGKEEIAHIETALAALGDAAHFVKKYGTPQGKPPFTLAVGDGNHSVATAKAYWQEIKQTLSPEEQQRHPARFCLVELENIQSPAIEIEPIHRVVFGADRAGFLKSATAFFAAAGAQVTQNGNGEQVFRLVAGAEETALALANSPWPIAAASLEAFLQDYLANHPKMQVDYIHGEAAVKQLAAKNALGIVMPPFQKSDLFRGVAHGGVLPKKTFSMGHATQKRYYLECRKIEK